MMRRIIVVILVGSCAAVLYLLDPAVSGLYPPCPWRSLAGVSCPGCGALRALHRLLHGDPAGALRLNAAATLLIPALGLCLLLRPGGWRASRRGRGR